MSTILKYILLLGLFFSPVLNAQQVKELPVDPRVQKSKLANGFTYYLVNNQLQKGYADFYLVRRVGENNEGRDETGFNQMVSELGLMGSRNFPGNTVVTYFEEMGLKMSDDFMVVNGRENSMYRVENVPVGRGGSIVDSTLLIIFNWMASINMDEEEVEVQKQLFQNRYAGVLPDTLMDGVNNCSSKDIRNFYYKWFRPEQQALIVVGDIDVKDFDSKIKTLFQALPRYLDKVVLPAKKVAEQSEVEVSVIPSSDAGTGKMHIYFTSPPLPVGVRTSAVPWVEEYMNTILSNLVSRRLTLASMKPDLPFAVRGVKYDRYMGLSDRDAFGVELDVNSENAEKVLSVVMDELYEIGKFGFTEDEFYKGQESYFKDLNYNYDWRIITPNQVYAYRAIDNFLGNYSLASIEMKKEYMDMIKMEIAPQNLNMYAASFFRKGDNCRIHYLYPYGDTLPDSLSVRLKGVAEKEIMAIRERRREGVGPDLFPEISLNVTHPVENAIVKEVPELITGSKMWTLSNGATVIFKNTQSQPDKFSFKAVSKGGLSLMGVDNPSRSFINELAKLTSVANLSRQELELYMLEEKFSLDVEFSLNTTSLSGRGYSGSLENFMKVVHSHFTAQKGDSDLFEKYKSLKRVDLEGNMMSVSRAFDDSLKMMRYHKSRYVSVQNLHDLDAIAEEDAFGFINKMFSNASGFYFIFSGDLNETLLREYVQKYIATIPGNQSNATGWNNVPVYIKKYNQRTHLKGEIGHNLYNITIHSAATYALQDIAVMSIIGNGLESRITSELGRLGIPVKSDFSISVFPEEFFTISIDCRTSEYMPQLEEMVLDIFGKVAQDGFSDREVGNVKKGMLEHFRRAESFDNAFWIDVLTSRFIYGKDFYSRFNQVVGNITPAEVNRRVKEYINGSTYTILTMEGTK